MDIKNISKNYKIIIFNSLLVILAIALSDWRFIAYGQQISISDVLILFSMVALIFLQRNRLQIFFKPMLIVIAVLILNLGLNQLFNTAFQLQKSLIYFIKIPVYTLFFLTNIELYKSKDHFKLLYRILRVTTFLIILIGIYINIVIYFDLPLPYNFIWKFTRQDAASYTFRNSDIIRMRSVFSEPSYLGLYLNFFLAINYFSPIIRKDIKKTDNFIVSVAIFMTLSFGSLFLLLFVKTLYFIREVNWYEIRRNKYFKQGILLLILLIIGMLYVLHPILYKTIYYRFYQIITGEDTSALKRLIYSWSYVHNLIIGNGVGQTPAIWNNFAYVLSDWGIFIFLFYIYYLYQYFKINPLLIVSISSFHFLKGGYLSAFHIVMMLITVISIKCQQREEEGFYE